MKTSRKILCWITVFAMFLTIMAPVYAATEYGIHWDLSEDGVLTITGSGEIRNFPWESESEKITKVVIEEGVTRICYGAFYNCVNLEEVVLPESLVIIDDGIIRSDYLKELYIPAGVCEISTYAFQYCYGLERIDVSPENRCFASDSMGVMYSKDMTMVLMAPTGFRGSYTIPSTVRSVGGEYEYEYPSFTSDSVYQVNEVYSPFQGCKGLTQIQISEGVEVIGYGAFIGCSGLTELVIPDSVVKIDDYGFSGCRGVEMLHIGSGLKVIGLRGFAGFDGLTELVVPGNVRNIGDFAFAESENLETVVLEDGVATIGKSAFVSCFKLGQVQLSSTLRQIPESAFRNCYELVNLTVPARVKSIDSLAFDNIEDLKKVTFEGDAPRLAKDAFEDRKIEFCYPQGNESWKSLVGTNAGTRTRIQWSSYEPEPIPEDSLYLLDTEYSEDVYNGMYIEMELWSDGTLKYSGNGFIGGHDGVYKDQVKKLVIEEGVGGTDINARFHCVNLEEVVLPDSINSLNSFLFSDCERLKKVTFLGDAVTFDENVFGSKNIEFFYPEGDESWELLVGTNVNQDTRIIWTAYEREEQDVPQKPEEPEKPTFGTMEGGEENEYGSIHWVLYDDGLMEITGTLDPRESYWRDVSHLIKKVVIGEGITILGFDSFKDCENLTEILLPDTLQKVDQLALRNCPKLERIRIPASVIELNPSAFDECENLAFFEVDPENPNYASDDRGVVFNKEMTMLLMAPRGMTGSYTVPDSVTELGGTITYTHNPPFVTTYGYSAFNGCGKLTEVVLPECLEQICGGAFANCAALQSIRLPEGLQQIGYRAFYRCVRLKEITVPGVEILYDETFAGCNALERVVLEEGIREIRYAAFHECHVLQEVVLPDSLRIIGSYAFRFTDLRTVTIPENVSSIAADAFSYTSLTHMVFLGEPPEMGLQTRMNFNYAYPEGNEAWLRVVEENKDAYYENYWLPYRTEYVDGQPRYVIAGGTDNGITWVLEANGTLTIRGTGIIGASGPWADMEPQILCLVVEEGITAVCAEAFAEYDRLSCVHLPVSLKSVGASAFANCGQIERLEIAGSVPAFEENCFANLSGVLCYDTADESWNEEALKGTGGSFILMAVEFPEKPQKPEEPEIPEQPGQPEKPEGMLGDMDGDGNLSYNDALIVLRGSIALVILTPEQEALADFDGNGTVNYNDALQILRASIGM